jgi:hypothetical protein
LLLAFNALDLDSVAPFLFIVAAISLVGVVVAVLQYRSYVDALHDVTTLGFADDPHAVYTARGDLLDRTYMVDELGSEAPGAVLATTGVLRALDHDPLGPAIPGLLAHPDPWAVELALDAAAASGEPSRASMVAQVLERDDLPAATLRRALGALAALDPAVGRSRVMEMLSGPRSEVALPAALDDPELRAEGVDRLEALARSLDAADRREAGGPGGRHGPRPRHRRGALHAPRRRGPRRGPRRARCGGRPVVGGGGSRRAPLRRACAPAARPFARSPRPGPRSSPRLTICCRGCPTRRRPTSCATCSARTSPWTAS